MKKIIATLVLSTFLAPALAASNSTTMQVTATVSPSCTISANAMSFGNYTGSTLTNNSFLTVNCTNGTSAVVTLDAGTNGATSVNARSMKSTGTSNYLNYNLYVDSSMTTIFGNTPSTGYSLTGTGSPTLLTVYGRIPASQFSSIGNYSDTIVATVNY